MYRCEAQAHRSSWSTVRAKRSIGPNTCRCSWNCITIQQTRHTDIDPKWQTNIVVLWIMIIQCSDYITPQDPMQLSNNFTSHSSPFVKEYFFAFAEGCASGAARLHSHLPVHALVPPLCNWVLHATEASLRVAHSGCRVHVLSFCRPHPPKFGISCGAHGAWCHYKPDCSRPYRSLGLVWCFLATWFHRWSLASFTPVARHHLLLDQEIWFRVYKWFSCQSTSSETGFSCRIPFT